MASNLVSFSKEFVTAKRTTHRSSAGKKLYAVRDAKGRITDMQTYERAHRADLAKKSKAEADKKKAEKKKAAKKKSVKKAGTKKAATKKAATKRAGKKAGRKKSAKKTTAK